MNESRKAEIIEALKARGHRMTPQRLAIVSEVLRIEGHISPPHLARRVNERIPGVNASTVYRTLELLEGLGVLAHAHLGAGPEYHHAEDADHVHLVCSHCRNQVVLAAGDIEPLQQAMAEHTGFLPDFTHFAVWGICAECRTAK